MSEVEYLNALRYSAHLSLLLKEACGILETLDVTVEVSDPLKCWWEKEKRKKLAEQCALVTPAGDKLVSHKTFIDQGVGKQVIPKIESSSGK